MTANNKYTPGPWHVFETCHQMNFPDTTVCNLKYHGQDKEFFIGSPLNDHGDVEATAKLIASAPELLQVLTSYVNSMLSPDYVDKWYNQYKDDKTANRVLVNAIAAIKKALD